MTEQFGGKVALVTGAASGIGRASALAFARAGVAVVLADIAGDAGEETARLVRAAGGDALFVETDVADPPAVERLIARAVATFGRLDYAHNNAGILGTPFVTTADYDEETFDRVLRINLKGVWLCLKYELPQMAAQGGGAIVNTASVAGLIGGRFGAAYYASKHGVVGLTKTAALEYATQGIRVNAVCPGFIRSPMTDPLSQTDPELLARQDARHPMGRTGTPEEVAGAVIWLCSDAASFVTGHAMVMDGGLVAQ